MDTVWFVGAVLPYVTFTVFCLGVGYRLWRWLSTPQPTPWPLYPLKNRVAAVAEVIVMKPHFKSDRALWSIAIVFHSAFLVSALLHIKDFIAGEVEAFEGIAFYFGAAAGAAAVVTTILFWLRRFTLPRVRVLSMLDDHLALGLLLVTLILGTYLRVFHVVEPSEVQSYIQSLVALKPESVPSHPVFLAHLFFGEIYLMYFPFSKPMHAFSSIINSFITTEVR